MGGGRGWSWNSTGFFFVVTRPSFYLKSQSHKAAFYGVCTCTIQKGLGKLRYFRSLKVLRIKPLPEFIRKKALFTDESWNRRTIYPYSRVQIHRNLKRCVYCTSMYVCTWILYGTCIFNPSSDFNANLNEGPALSTDILMHVMLCVTYLVATLSRLCFRCSSHTKILIPTQVSSWGGICFFCPGCLGAAVSEGENRPPVWSMYIHTYTDTCIVHMPMAPINQDQVPQDDLYLYSSFLFLRMPTALYNLSRRGFSFSMTGARSHTAFTVSSGNGYSRQPFVSKGLAIFTLLVSQFLFDQASDEWWPR